MQGKIMKNPDGKMFLSNILLAANDKFCLTIFHPTAPLKVGLSYCI